MHYLGGVDVFYPTIAANRLAFTQIHGGRPVYQIEGPSSTHPSSGAIRLIASTRSNYTPQFSPDGESIAFESDRSGTHEIWICRRDGTSPTQLTNFLARRGGFTSFESADGKFLYYSKGPPGVWRVPVDGGEENVNEFVSGLAVSPDEGRILYTQQESLAGDIMLVENFR